MQRQQHSRSKAATVIALSLCLGCGPLPPPAPLKDAPTTKESDSIEQVPHRSTSLSSSTQPANVFWLDLDGQSLVAEDSFIVSEAGLSEITIPPLNLFDFSALSSRAAFKKQLLAEVEALFMDLNVIILLDRPNDRTTSQVHIGGKNFTHRRDILGIAPLDQGNHQTNEHLFVFSEELARKPWAERQKQLALIIAHEISHALGARHIDNPQALLLPHASLEAKNLDSAGLTLSKPPEIENSYTLLRHTVGLRGLSPQLTPELPQIMELSSSEDEDYRYLSLVTSSRE